MSLSQLVHTAAARHPDSAAIVGEQFSVSYAQLAERVDGAASLLRSRQVQAGDTVAIGLAQAPYWQWVFTLGALRMGALPAVLGAHPHLELRAIPGAPPHLVAAQGSALAHLPGVRAIGVSSADLQKIESTRIVMGLPDAAAADATVGLILFGGLDAPRALRLEPQTVHARCQDLVELLRLSPGSRLLGGAGLGVALRLEAALAVWAADATLVLAGGSDDLGAQLVTASVSRLLIPPRALVALLRSDALPNLDTLGCQVTVAGAPLPVAWAEKVRSVFGAAPQLMLSGPESGVYCRGGIGDLAAHRDCVGRARPGVVVEVVDRAGRPMPDGQNGLIRVRTPLAAAGYLDGGDSGTGLGLRQGWYDTGLLGHLASDGRLCVSAAAVHPGKPAPAPASGAADATQSRLWNRAELEQALAAVPGMVEVCVLSQPMPDRSTVPVVVYTSDTDDTLEQMARQVQALIGDGTRFHLIRVPSLPRLDDGTVDRNGLATSLQAHIRKARTAAAAETLH